jgi:glutamate formiminotransferase/glutamate formiminotransferase/formiminotetrahydrofolate cyclodeaminase
MEAPILLAVPNVSEGRDEPTIAALAHAFTGPTGHSDRAGLGPSKAAVRLLDVHSDRDHHRSVFTLAGLPGGLADAILAGAHIAVERIDVVSRAELDRVEAGQHPHVGAVDVAPVVYLEGRARGAACAEALVVADRVGAELGVPVFLYGELTSAGGSDRARTRAELRRGGVAGLAERMDGEERLAPDFGPPRLHPSAGATLVAARPPLVAFNLELSPPATLADARRIAGLIREGGEEGLPGVRAMGVALGEGVAQVSMNLELPFDVSMAMVAQAVGRHAAIAAAELVGLAPRAALEGFPEDLPMPGFDPARHVIENALGSW